jgi:hypothetical protein
MTDEDRPVLRIVRGAPDDDEVAALAAVVAGLVSSAGRSTRPAPRSRWADPSTLVRRPLPTGPDAWWASGLPS